ncbi:MAG: phosphoribosylformimino-5-aminoimidazole carboxamide ribotide isomerase [Desulfopila sp.]|jgi:phosphoribosylformimino-5-aminoimidazole carboxamide ribotide isomerase|nr:phosphoribosylformimino-5-aminoimidazole carboxamide ribotide isomerase [Desulfopila sp.]
MKFRPCIDLHNGKVKQIVGSSLSDEKPDELQTNFVAEMPSGYFAEMYRRDNLSGGHIIKLGPGNDEAAVEALRVWPGNIQIGGGITLENAGKWLDHGASHVIVTSSVFKNGKVDHDYLAKLVRKIGRKRLVLDLSCRRRDDTYFVVTERWQNFTEVAISPENLDYFAGRCDELLVHAADVEGKCEGIEEELVEKLGRWVSVPTTYAGGIRHLDDFQKIDILGRGHLDATIGSALDIFGGSGVAYADVVSYVKETQKRRDSL